MRYFILLILLSIKSFAQEVHCTLPFYPTGAIVHHSYFDLQYSEQHEQALWVAYKLTPGHLIKNVKRSNKFKTDPKVKTGSASLADYKASGYDRGHLAPAGSMTFNKTAMDESFYMSNMSPQLPGFNRGIWKKLETKVREWTKVSDSLYVVSGPVLKNITKTIGANKVAVPKAYYKVLLQFKNGKVKTCAYLLPNEKSNKDLKHFICSINKIETIIGIDFNKNLDDNVEYELEHHYVEF